MEEYLRDARDTLDSLTETARNLVEEVGMVGARRYFEEDGEVGPIIIALTPEDRPKILKAYHRNDAEKNVVWSFLRLMRYTHPNVILVNEVWFSEPKGKEGPYVPPSEDPNHKEAVMVHLWSGDRTVIFVAKITRNPDRMGEFKVMHDSYFPVNGMDTMAGNLMEGEPYPGRRN